jgi:hypothetical protein
MEPRTLRTKSLCEHYLIPVWPSVLLVAGPYCHILQWPQTGLSGFSGPSLPVTRLIAPSDPSITPSSSQGRTRLRPGESAQGRAVPVEYTYPVMWQGVGQRGVPHLSGLRMHILYNTKGTGGFAIVQQPRAPSYSSQLSREHREGTQGSGGHHLNNTPSSVGTSMRGQMSQCSRSD